MCKLITYDIVGLLVISKKLGAVLGKNNETGEFSTKALAAVRNLSDSKVRDLPRLRNQDAVSLDYTRLISTQKSRCRTID